MCVEELLRETKKSENSLGSSDHIEHVLEVIRSTRQGSFDSILQQPALTVTALAVVAVLQHYFLG
jgi:hypothetical protein